MRDYKFNHSGLDFDKPRRPIGRWLLRLTILGIIAVGAYLAYVSIDWDDEETSLRTNDNPNVIPLEIPPNTAPDSTDEGEVGTS